MLDKYRIIEKLGTGGTSCIYLVEHRLLHTHRVIKCVSKQSSYSQNFLKESHILSQLHHERIPIMYDQDEDDQNYYMIMEYIYGKSFKSYILEQEHLSEYSILFYSLQICNIIHYLHTLENPILYLDMKPDNLIITDQDISLVDFGNAAYKHIGYVDTNTMGTVGYAAPEQYSGGNLDERTDIYGIGMIMYFMATKQLFTNKECIQNIELAASYSRQFKYIVNRCVQEDSNHRYQSVEKLIVELNKLINRYNKLHKSSLNTSLVIAVAGLQAKVGTTHVALAISKYLNHIVGPSIYIERNDSLHVNDVINYNGDFNEQDGLYISSYLNILPYDKLGFCSDDDRRYLSDYNVIVEDYGIFRMDRLSMYTSADVCFIVTLSKPWEITSSLLRETKKLMDTSVLLINLASDMEYHEFVVRERLSNTYRVPYIANLLSDRYETYVWQALHTFLSDSISDESLIMKIQEHKLRRMIKRIVDLIPSHKEK